MQKMIILESRDDFWKKVVNFVFNMSNKMQYLDCL